MNSKIEELTKQLIAELEAQGHDMKTNDGDLSHVDIWIWKGKLLVGNSKWEIECGEVAV